ncbi:YfgG family protein [Pectobacteriaceae bacterium CE70]|nr:YfgG family protein [Pectobacteriaceae bacterium CE70]WJY09756.1 YfgG family protein [Pectobacteriaceae bacterium C80]
MSTITHRRRISIRHRRRSSSVARTVLMISFIILLGRVTYSAIGAFFLHQDKQQEFVEQSLITADNATPPKQE